MIRASASLKLPIPEIFNPLVPIQAIGLIFIFTAAWWLGKREERRLGLDKGAALGVVPARTLTEAEKILRQPQNFWINIALTLVVMGTMVALGDKLAPAIVFMVGTCLALLINYRDVDMQRQRIDAHARAALLMASILLAAGVFTGIMQNSGMLKAMAQTAVAFIPAAMAKFMPIVLGVLSMPLSLLFDPELVLLRRPPSHRRGRRPARRAEGAVRPGSAARPNDDWLPGEPADARDLLGRRPVRHRACRPSAVLDPVPVRRLDRHDDRLRRARRVPLVRRVKR